jgi:16S rRNA (adenine(1408)-N(1))-methyltransferase
LFIASDANAISLAKVAWRAGRKAERGGIPNLICIAEPLDILATELGEVADRISVILPWGSLLLAVGAPELVALRRIANLCVPDAAVEIVFSYDERRDTQQGIMRPIGGFDEGHIATLPGLYQKAGLQIVAVDRFSQKELADYQTTWAKRLAFGRARKIWRLRARYVGPEVIATNPHS